MSAQASPRSHPIPSAPDSYRAVHAAAVQWAELAADPRATHRTLLAAQLDYREAKRAAGIIEDWEPPRKKYNFRGQGDRHRFPDTEEGP